MLLSLFRYRNYIIENAWREIRHRYADTQLGISWNILHPLTMLLIFSIVFGNIMLFRMPGMESSKFSFALYLCSGYLPWIAFSQSLLTSTNIFMNKRSFLARLDVPEHVFIAQSVLTGFFQLILSIFILFALALIMGHQPSITWLYVLVVGLMLQILVFGLSLALGTLNVFFRDIGQLIGVFLPMWMWLSPIVYVEEILPTFFRTLLVYNPLYPFLLIIRQSFLLNQTSSHDLWLNALGWCLSSLLVGYLIFTALRKEIRDVV